MPGAGTGAGGRWRRVVGVGLVLVLALAILTGPPRSWAQQPPISATQGHAQIIAQGVVSPPAEAAWRVVYRTIEPNRPGTISGAGELALADQGTLLLAQANDAPWVALGQGEARQLPAGMSLRATALDERPAGYYEIALVAPDAREEAGAGLLIYATGAFAAPSGPRDIKLIRDILEPDETTSITPTTPAAPVLVLVTLGTVVVETAGGAPVELRVGQAVAVAGELTVRGAGLAPASFVAAVVGRELPSGPATPVGSPVASPQASPQPVGATVSIQVHACPVGMRPGESNPSRCPPDPVAADLRLVAQPAGGDEVDLGPPVTNGDRAEWTDLPPGDYALRAAGFGPEFDRFFVPGLAGLSGDAGAGYAAGPDGGYRIPITDPTAVFQLDAFAYATEDRLANGTPVVRTTAVAVRQERSGDVSLRVFACPTVGLVSFDPAACAPATPPYEVTLLPPTGGEAITLADTTPGEDGVQAWTGLAPGTYVLQVPQMPAGTVAYFINEAAGVSLLPDSTGYAVAVADAAPLAVDLYTVGPEPAPPTVAATAAPTLAPTVAAVVDTDGDGLTDSDEVNVQGTDPGVWDTDGDGTGDGDELAAGTDPLTAGAPAPAPAPAVDTGDLDSDGLADVDEAAAGADPNNPDTDADGWLDGNEILLGTNPVDPASFPQSP